MDFVQGSHYFNCRTYRLKKRVAGMHRAVGIAVTCAHRKTRYQAMGAKTPQGFAPSTTFLCCNR